MFFASSLERKKELYFFHAIKKILKGRHIPVEKGSMDKKIMTIISD